MRQVQGAKFTVLSGQAGEVTSLAQGADNHSRARCQGARVQLRQGAGAGLKTSS